MSWRNSSLESIRASFWSARPIGSILMTRQQSICSSHIKSYSAFNSWKFSLWITEVTWIGIPASWSAEIAFIVWRKLPGVRRSWSWVASSPSRLMVIEPSRSFFSICADFMFIKVPFVVIPHGKPSSTMCFTIGKKSGCSSGSPPVRQIITECGVKSSATVSSVCRSRSVPIYVLREGSQLLPQCRQDRLQQFVSSTNRYVSLGCCRSDSLKLLSRSMSFDFTMTFCVSNDHTSFRNLCRHRLQGFWLRRIASLAVLNSLYHIYFLKSIYNANLLSQTDEIRYSNV